MGGGTTAIADLETGSECVEVKLLKNYAELAAKRIENLLAKDPKSLLLYIRERKIKDSRFIVSP